MKKLLFMIAGAAMLSAGCNDFNEPMTPENKAMPTVLSATRSPEEAQICAAEAFSTFYGISRSLTPLKNVKCFTKTSDSRAGDTDTLFYVVNTDENMGYAVIAANRNSEPVLAVTERGNIESLDDIDNPGAIMFFDALIETASFELNPNIRPIDSTTIIQPNPWWSGGDVNPYPNTPQYKEDVQINNYYEEPRTPFEWGQRMPEGLNCPNGLSGCVNTACALVASYFEEPKRVSQTIFPAELAMVDWALAKQHKSSWFSLHYDECGKDTDAPSHLELAKACRAFGIANNSSYKTDATSATLKAAHNTFKNASMLNVSNIIDGMPNAYNDLGEGIIFVAGIDTEKNVGHAFVVDGYHHQTVITRTLKRDPGEAFWYEINRRTNYYNYNHINWGWSGKDNGYFRHDIFNNNNANEYDSELMMGDEYDFSHNISYFIIEKNN